MISPLLFQLFGSTSTAADVFDANNAQFAVVSFIVLATIGNLPSANNRLTLFSMGHPPCLLQSMRPCICVCSACFCLRLGHVAIRHPSFHLPQSAFPASVWRGLRCHFDGQRKQFHSDVTQPRLRRTNCTRGLHARSETERLSPPVSELTQQEEVLGPQDAFLWGSRKHRRRHQTTPWL